MDPRSVESVAARLAALDLHMGCLDVAEEVPRIFRELVDALGASEGQRRFDQALARAIGSGPAAA